MQKVIIQNHPILKHSFQSILKSLKVMEVPTEDTSYLAPLFDRTNWYMF